ncbi:protein valois-like [Drosophila obscura]|uniref:protein valois-like n=1 Tax=Drosophila obscura TaxID=7282 RepID=UPI001BB1B52F|nr:protein valois-like [Drosophila obscura]
MFPQKSSELYRTPDDHKPPTDINLAGNLEYPNLNAADVRAQPENFSARLHDCWDSITIDEEKNCVVATNRRDGGQWWGMFFGYSEGNIDHMTVDNADFQRQEEHTVNIVRYAENNVLLAALGNTKLQAWSTRPTPTVINAKKPFCLSMLDDADAHMAPISHLSVFKADPQKSVSASADGDMKLWTIAEARLESFYHARVAHSDKFTGLATPLSTPNQFVTCDRGGCVRLWDDQLLGDNHVYLGDIDGDVHIADIRVPRKLLQTTKYFEDAIVSQIVSNGAHLAVMSNLPACVKIAKVDGTGKQAFIYTKENIHQRQTDAIWTDPRTLITVGYGCRMVKHQLEELGKSAGDCGE